VAPTRKSTVPHTIGFPAYSRRRNNFIIQAVNIAHWGEAWGQIAMTDAENWKERREQWLRYRAMERESTDPLAVGLLHDIVLELQADLLAVSAGEHLGLRPDQSG
jgi:hypothetical protein